MQQTFTRPDHPVHIAQLSVDASRDRDALRVRLGGELDLATAVQLVATLDRHRGGYQRIIYELEELTFMDCSGLRGLLAPHDSGLIDEAITIARASRAVQRVLELLEMRQMLPS